MAQEDQKTFTDLVRQLVGRCASDVEKARTIFRWITVKNLNNIQFDDNLRGDSPLGLLRGIKHGTESYHVLFKRLCRYEPLIKYTLFKLQLVELLIQTYLTTTDYKKIYNN